MSGGEAVAGAAVTSKDISEKTIESVQEESNKDSESPATAEKENKEKVDFKVVYNKKKFDVTFDLDDTIGALKVHLADIIDVPNTMQKVMIKGLAKDEMTLRQVGVTKGAKVMVVGSTITDILEVNKKPTAQQLKEEAAEEAAKESWSEQKLHKKVLEKGKPDDVMAGLKNIKESLPGVPLSGMLNKSGGKVRLTFKMELDQLWIGTKERTEKVPLNSIKNVVSEAIKDHEEYHIIALQLGPTEASRYFVYWVPAQYVDAIKEAILGKWQLF